MAKPTCRNCGSSHFRAWYPVDEGQTIDVWREKDGSLGMEYTGATESGESGADTEYWCLECEWSGRSLAYLVGDQDEDDPEPETTDTALEAVRGILSTPGMSAGDVYAELATWLDARDKAPYDYDDPANPYGEPVHAIDCDMDDDCTCEANDDERG